MDSSSPSSPITPDGGIDHHPGDHDFSSQLLEEFQRGQKLREAFLGGAAPPPPRPTASLSEEAVGCAGALFRATLTRFERADGLAASLVWFLCARAVVGDADARVERARESEVDVMKAAAEAQGRARGLETTMLAVPSVIGAFASLTSQVVSPARRPAPARKAPARKRGDAIEN